MKIITRRIERFEQFIQRFKEPVENPEKDPYWKNQILPPSEDEDTEIPDENEPIEEPDPIEEMNEYFSKKETNRKQWKSSI